jgi:hypothetical protein
MRLPNLILAASLSLAALNAQAQSAKRTDMADTKMVTKAPETMPSFPGGLDGWADFLRKNLNAQLAVGIVEADTNLAKQKVFTEKIKLEFIVCEDGGLCNIRVLNKDQVHPELADEAVRVLRLSPAWNPGTQKGQKVKVFFTQPITFQVD